MSECFRGAAIAFDLDGTLVDTAPDLVRALNVITAQEGFAPTPLEEVRAMVGRGARALIERAFAAQGRTLAGPESEALTRRYIDIYRESVAGMSRPFPDAVDTLDRLSAAGARLSVCTNKPQELSELVLEALGLAHRFERIVGPERTRAKKPDPAHLLDSLGSGWTRAAMVGDSAPDVASARAAGVPVIIISHGYTEAPASTLGADRVIDEFGELPEALEALWASAKS